MNNYDRTFLNLLNLDSSLIKNIESSMDDNGINTVIVTPSPISKECIYCGNKKLKSKGFYTTSSINAIDATKDCIVHYKIKRHYCDQCNLSFTDEYHIKPRNGNLSYSTIQKIMTLLSNASITFRQVAKLLHVSPQSVLRTFDKYCHVVPMSFPEVLCIDEVYTKNSDFDSKFSCVFYDFFHRKILDITPSRHKAYLLSYLERFPEDERNKVLYVCMDMYSPYKDVIQLRFKKSTMFKRRINYRDLLNAILATHSDLFKTYE